ncbi:MAG: beta-ketoacyl synthase N-terminal-like domain-containing protein [Pseudonocardiaceae bacterium]
MAPPVVITGMGAVTVFGDGCAALFDALRKGQSGVHALRDIPVARGKDRSTQVEDPRRTGPWRLSDMAADAAIEAIAQAGLTIGESGPADPQGREPDGVTGLFIATTGGDSRALEERYGDFLAACEALTRHGSPKLDDELANALVRFPTGALADELAGRLRLAGPRYVATNACASGAIAMALALTALRQGTVNRALVIGADQVKATSYWGAERSGFIGHDLRPFHVDRDGSVLGDGAGALVLEHSSAARRRGAEPLAQLAGWGITCDENPQAIVPPEDGADNAAAIRLALMDAGVDSSEVDYFNAHGTGTPLIDRLETNSVKAALGEQAYRLAVSSTKSMTGHLAAASPVIEAIATVYCLRTAWVHPTAKLNRVDPALDLDYVPLKGRTKTLRAAASNSLGGGGSNAVVVLRAPSEPPRPTRGDPDRNVQVVVTGCGAITRLGDGAACLRAAYGTGPVRKRGNPFSVLDHIDASSGYQYLSGTAQLAYAAAALALADAGLAVPLTTSGSVPARRVAVVVGTALGGTSTWSDLLCRQLLDDPRRITPRMALDHGPQLGTTLIARAANITGPVITLTTGVTAGLQAVEVGRWLLAAGACDIVVVGAADAADAPLRDAARLLAHRHGHPSVDDVAAELADGAGCLVLERDDFARGRDAHPKATLDGCATWAVPVGPGTVDESGNGLARCMQAAMPAERSDQLYLSYHIGGTLADPSAHKIVSSGFRAAALGQALAATPMLAAVAAVEHVHREPDVRTLVTALAPGGGTAALVLGPVLP